MEENKDINYNTPIERAIVEDESGTPLFTMPAQKEV
jgi:hypothetical protein